MHNEAVLAKLWSGWSLPQDWSGGELVMIRKSLLHVLGGDTWDLSQDVYPLELLILEPKVTAEEKDSQDGDRCHTFYSAFLYPLGICRPKSRVSALGAGVVTQVVALRVRPWVQTPVPQKRVSTFKQEQPLRLCHRGTTVIAEMYG
jgi:hypothetical protein